MLLDDQCYRLRSARDHWVIVRNLKDVAALNNLHAAFGCVYFTDAQHASYVSGWRFASA